MFNNMIKVVTSASFVGAIFSTIFIILLGYYARKKNIVPEQGGKVLSNVVLSLSLPALAFNAFMSDITKETFTTGINVLIFGFIAYVILIILGEVIFFKLKGDKKTTMSVLTTFGSTTFFGIPIINGFLGSIGTIYANIFNIAYRVFLYSYGLIRMSGLKFEKKNLKQIFLNPIVIATFLGLFIWLFQSSLPQVSVKVGDTMKSYAFLRIDKTVPWLETAIKYLANLASPLAWLAIGMTLGNISLGDAVKDKLVWFYSFAKLLVVPAIFLIILIVLKPILSMSYEAVMAIILMLSTPPATVAVAYAIKYEKEPVLASNASLLGTVLAVFAMVFWIIVGALLKGLF